MTRYRRQTLTALLFALSPCAAAAVPASLTGEWLTGAQYPADVYTSDFTGAAADAQRLVLNKDGTYLYTEFESTHYPSSFGTTGYPITCQFMDATLERGTFSVANNKITMKAASVSKMLAYTPDRLNNGCKRSAGTKKTNADRSVNSLSWQVASGKLTLKSAEGSATYARRTPAPVPPPARNVTGELRGEWHSGRISPVEYYNTATGKWAEASGTSVILKLGPNFSYERTGLMVVTTYGCTSKLLVTEKGKVRQNGNTLTFTPATSAATGYTCTPSKVSTSKNHIKPYSERYQVRVEANGQHVLSLQSEGSETLFNRPLGTAPESSPNARGPLTPPAPGTTGSSGPNTRPAPPSAAPTRWNARGKWDAVITTTTGTVRVRFDLDDDEPRILGSGFSGEEVVAWVQGNSATGALKIGLEVGNDEEVELSVTGKFGDNTYSGRFTATNANDEDLAGGTITMTRR